MFGPSFSCCAAPNYESAAEGYAGGIKLGGGDTSYNTAKSLPRPSENDFCFKEQFWIFCEGLNTRVMAKGWDKICSMSAYYSCGYRPCLNNTTSAKSTSSGAPSVDWTPYAANVTPVFSPLLHPLQPVKLVLNPPCLVRCAPGTVQSPFGARCESVRLLPLPLTPSLPAPSREERR